MVDEVRTVRAYEIETRVRVRTLRDGFWAKPRFFFAPQARFFSVFNVPIMIFSQFFVEFRAHNNRKCDSYVKIEIYISCPNPNLLSFVSQIRIYITDPVVYILIEFTFRIMKFASETQLTFCSCPNSIYISRNLHFREFTFRVRTQFTFRVRI